MTCHIEKRLEVQSQSTYTCMQILCYCDISERNIINLPWQNYLKRKWPLFILRGRLGRIEMFDNNNDQDEYIYTKLTNQYLENE